MHGLEDMCGFSQLSNEELDRLVRNYIDHHGTTSGQTYIIGYIKSLGYHVQRSRIREWLARLDPRNTALRWGITVSRRVYTVYLGQILFGIWTAIIHSQDGN